MTQAAMNRSHLCPRLRPCMVANVVPIEPVGSHKLSKSPAMEEDLERVSVPHEQGTSRVGQNTSSLRTITSGSKTPVQYKNSQTKQPHPERKAKSIADWFNLFPEGRKPIWEGWGGGRNSNRSRALFPTQEATGGFLKTFSFGDPKGASMSATEQLSNVNDPSSTHEQVQENFGSKDEPTKHSFPSWSTWKDWKKISIDLYFRLTDNPRNSRIRLKQTLALLPVAKIKPIIDLGYKGPNQPPISMRLDLKFLDCVKYMIQPDGNSILQVRAKAPLSDPRFVMDVLYEREMKTSIDTVKISFRALDIAFLKAPGFGFGFRFPLRFDNGIKITIGTKKYFGKHNGPQHVVNAGPSQHEENQYTRRHRNSRNASRSHQAPSSFRKRPRFQIHGPTKIDLKIRCLEYR